jgi:hypothetical protein
LGCALAGTVLGWQVREARGPELDAPELDAPDVARAVSVHGLELLPPVLEVGLTGPWSEAPRPLPGAPRWLEDPGPLREWHEGFRALNAGVERPPPLGPALAEAFLATPELFLTQYASRFDVPALDLYGPRPGTNKGQERVASSRQPKKDGGSLPAGGRLLALCAGLSMAACSAVQVREADAEWLEDCSPEAMTAMRALGLKFGIPYGVGLPYVDTRDQSPHAIREGPLVARGLYPRTDLDPLETLARLKGSKLSGLAKRYGGRMSVRFERLRLQGGEEFPICAVSYDHWGQEPGLERWGPGSHPGVDVANDAPEFLAWLETLGPGDFPIVGPTRVSFGGFLRPEYVTLR